MKVSTEIDNDFGYEKITQLVDNIPLSLPGCLFSKSHKLLLRSKLLIHTCTLSDNRDYFNV
jgi:hypothetical protein